MCGAVAAGRGGEGERIGNALPQHRACSMEEPDKTAWPCSDCWSKASPLCRALSIYSPVMPLLQWLPHSYVGPRQLHRIIIRGTMKCPGHWQLIWLTAQYFHKGNKPWFTTEATAAMGAGRLWALGKVKSEIGNISGLSSLCWTLSPGFYQDWRLQDVRGWTLTGDFLTLYSSSLRRSL